MRVAVVPVLRTIAWTPVLASALIALTVFLVSRHMFAPATVELVALLRYGALILALGFGFVLDDEAAPTIGAVPTTLATRRTLRIVLTLPIVIATWTIMLATTDTSRLSRWAVSLELAGLLAVALALAAWSTRDPVSQRGGLVAAPTVLALFVAARELPEWWALLPPPFTEQWPSAHQRWAGILVVAIVIGARASRDTNSRDRWRGT